jgi:hypothetical protein
LAEARARLEGFENEEEAKEDIADWARVEAVSVKRGVFAALYDYVRAYGFWALKPSSITPSMSDEAPAYRLILSAMEKEISDALSRGFVPAPQPFGSEHQLDKEIRVSRPERLAALRRGEPAVVTVGADEPVFRDYGRVRVERVRAWLDVIKSEGRPLLVEIQSGGSFFDRLGDETFLFTSDRFLLTFQYVPEKGEKGIVTDGLVARRVRDLYCLPTPFTDWTIKVMHADGKGIDLSGLKALRLSFAGSHIYSPGCGRQGS